MAKRQHALFHECREIREEIDYDQDEMLSKLHIALHGQVSEEKGKLTPSQLKVFEVIRDVVEGRSTEKQIFIDARGGSGKTFLLNRLLYYIRTLDSGAIGLAVAFAGIAAQLLQTYIQLKIQISYQSSQCPIMLYYKGQRTGKIDSKSSDNCLG